MEGRKLCPECHHYPSERFEEGQVAKCYCKCHDVADIAPDLLQACQMLLAVVDRLPNGHSPERVTSAAFAKEVIAKAKGQ